MLTEHKYSLSHTHKWHSIPVKAEGDPQTLYFPLRKQFYIIKDIESLCIKTFGAGVRVTGRLCKEY